MNRITKTGLMGFALAGGMVGLGYASVPLYRVFCQVTGFGGTTQRAAASEVPGAVQGSSIVVRFDANHAPTLPWEFKPEQITQTIPLGGRSIAFYQAKNLVARPVTGMATFNVTPAQAGKYFSKIECFCFTEQTLSGGKSVRMPVMYFVDPKIATDPETRNISEITLSYTFYPVDGKDTAG